VAVPLLYFIALIACSTPTAGAADFAVSALAVFQTHTPTPFQPVPATPTPFNAVRYTPTVSPTPTATKTRAPLTGRWHGIDFNDTTRRIELTITPAGEQFNGGQPLRIGFRPGRPCAYFDFRACIGLHESPSSAVILATVHSGLGGDGQPLRHALEGTGFNQAAFTLGEIQQRMDALQDAPVTIQQGDASTDRQLRAAARVPPNLLDAYFNLPFQQALETIAQTSPALARALKSPAPLLIIETCGWRQAQEFGIPGATDTTGSVYLLVIQ